MNKALFQMAYKIMTNKPDPTSETNAAHTADYLKNARDAAFVMAVFLYFAGWLYIYFYLDSFGIPIKAVDLDLYNLLIYASNVFIFGYNFGKVYLFILLAIIVALLFWQRGAQVLNKAVPILVVVLFPFIFYIGRKAGQYDAENTMINPAKYLKSIGFIFKDIKAEIEPVKKSRQDTLVSYNTENRFALLQQNRREVFRLVALNKEEYFVLKTGTIVTEANFASYVPVIYIIKKDMLEFVKITK